MVHSPSTEPPAHSTAPTRLIESGVELLRAELAVVLARARHAAIRAVAAILATILAAALLQVALVVSVLSPLLARTLPSQTMWIAIVVPALLAVASGLAAVLAWASMARSVKRSAPHGNGATDTNRAADSVGAATALASLQEERIRQ
jgi:hypothetical protein